MLYICFTLTMTNKIQLHLYFRLMLRRRRRPNICLTCFAVPEGLGVKLAERSDRKFYDKGNVRSKQLLGETGYIPVIKKSIAEVISCLADKQSQTEEPMYLFGIPANCCVSTTYFVFLIDTMGFKFRIIPFSILSFFTSGITTLLSRSESNGD